MPFIIFILMEVVGVFVGFGGVGWAMSKGMKDMPALKLKMFFTSSLEGQTDPCDCQSRQLGGLDRIQAFINHEKAKGNPKEIQIYLDSGDTFFSMAKMPDSALRREVFRSRFVARSLESIGLDALVPGEKDFAGGIEFLKELQRISGAEFVAANLLDTTGNPIFKKFFLLKRGEISIGVVGLVGEEAFSRTKGVQVTDPSKALREAVLALKERGANPIILLSHMGLKGDKIIAKEGNLDVIVGGHSLDYLEDPVEEGKTLIVQAKNQGQQAGILIVDLGGKKKLGYRLVDLGKEWEEANEVSKLIKRYKDEAGLLDSQRKLEGSKGGK